jgi:hypothetical protein
MVATILVFGIVIWVYGCQSTAPSPLTNQPATRAKLVVEAEKYAADLALAYADIDRQDAFKRQILEMGVAVAQTGTVNPLGMGLSLLGLLSTGLLVDNRRKDVAIVAKTNALTAVVQDQQIPTPPTT